MFRRKAGFKHSFDLTIESIQTTDKANGYVVWVEWKRGAKRADVTSRVALLPSLFSSFFSPPFSFFFFLCVCFFPLFVSLLSECVFVAALRCNRLSRHFRLCARSFFFPSLLFLSCPFSSSAVPSRSSASSPSFVSFLYALLFAFPCQMCHIYFHTPNAIMLNADAPSLTHHDLPSSGLQLHLYFFFFV